MGVNLDKLLEHYGERMDSAADDDNSLDKTIYDCFRAQSVLLVGILQELQSIRKALESRNA